MRLFSKFYESMSLLQSVWGVDITFDYKGITCLTNTRTEHKNHNTVWHIIPITCLNIRNYNVSNKKWTSDRNINTSKKLTD